MGPGMRRRPAVQELSQLAKRPKHVPEVPPPFFSRCRGPLEPSRDGVAGMARDPGGRRNAHALDAQARNLVEFPTSAAKAAVRCPRVGAERSPADCAAVPPPSARLRCKRAVAHDVEAQFPTVFARGLGARQPVDAVHRSSVLGGKPVVSSTISELKVTDQQRPAQAPDRAGRELYAAGGHRPGIRPGERPDGQTASRRAPCAATDAAPCG